MWGKFHTKLLFPHLSSTLKATWTKTPPAWVTSWGVASVRSCPSSTPAEAGQRLSPPGLSGGSKPAVAPIPGCPGTHSASLLLPAGVGGAGVQGGPCKKVPCSVLVREYLGTWSYFTGSPFRRWPDGEPLVAWSLRQGQGGGCGVEVGRLQCEQGWC